jgi:hypothetical protein
MSNPTESSSTDPNNKVGSLLQSLPVSDLIAMPLISACNAQIQLSQATANFIKDVGIDEKGNVRNVKFKYSNNEKEEAIDVPLLSILNIPSLSISEVNIDLCIAIDAMSKNASADEKKDDTSFGLDVNAGAAYNGGLVSAKFDVNASYNTSSSVVNKSTNDNALNTKATYNISVKASDKQPQGLQNVLKIFADSINKSVDNPKESA